MNEKKRDIFEENDGFWDIEAMLPKKKLPSFKNDTSAVSVNIPSHAEDKENECSERIKSAREALKMAEEKHLRHVSKAFSDRGLKDQAEIEITGKADEPIVTYIPEDIPLIKEVCVKLWPARYSFYSQFRTDAIRLFDKSSKKCEHVHFFSYSPQYSQLNKEQLEFYLFFRQMLKNGTPIEADYSYILLLIYEIINLPDLISPEEGLSLLCLIWKSYRKKHVRLDRLLSEWVCDYCLIHKISTLDIENDILKEAVNICSLKEFYVTHRDKNVSPYASALFSYSSAYNYKKSKFIDEENQKLFDTHIKNAFLYAFTKAEKEGLTVFTPVGKSSMVSKNVKRDAYNGAICAYSVKRQLEISYLCCSQGIELRYTVTDAIKYAENQVRAMLGIRSRFHTPNLAQPLKNAIDEYFVPYKKEKHKENKENIKPEYDILYEPEKTELSLTYAKNIEKKAWSTTSLLTEDMCYEEVSFPEPKEAVTKSDNDNENDNVVKKALKILISNGSDTFMQYCKEEKMLPDALCEQINEKMYDVIGDIVIEKLGEKYSPVNDYLEEIKEWMNK